MVYNICLLLYNTFTSLVEMHQLSIISQLLYSY